MARPKPRRFMPKHPDKYVGDPTKIILRSSWEVKYAKLCDLSPKILKWNSEDVKIPYKCPTDNRMHLYHIDFYIKTSTGEEFLIEIKPKKECSPPRKNKNMRRFIAETMTYVKNQAKWAAATAYAEARKMEFYVLDEYALGIKK